MDLAASLVVVDEGQRVFKACHDRVVWGITTSKCRGWVFGTGHSCILRS